MDPQIQDLLAPFCEALRAETERDLVRHEADLGCSQLPSLQQFDPELELFCAALRDSTNAQLASGSSQPLAVPVPPRRTRRSAGRIAGGVAMAAAAMLIFSLTGTGGFVQMGEGISKKISAMAPWNKRDSLEDKRVVEAARGTSGRLARRALEKTESIVEQSTDAVLDEELEAKDVRTEAFETIQAPQPQTRPQPSDKYLMRQGHKLWKEGKLKRAQRLIRRVAYRSPDRDAAQSAFADLFSIARQLGGRSNLLREWSRYLKKFPKGRYAQDALAGQCLAKVQKDSASRCWTRYLERFPRGSYARKAKQATKTPSDP